MSESNLVLHALCFKAIHFVNDDVSGFDFAVNLFIFLVLLAGGFKSRFALFFIFNFLCFVNSVLIYVAFSILA